MMNETSFKGIPKFCKRFYGVTKQHSSCFIMSAWNGTCKIHISQWKQSCINVEHYLVEVYISFGIVGHASLWGYCYRQVRCKVLQNCVVLSPQKCTMTISVILLSAKLGFILITCFQFAITWMMFLPAILLRDQRNGHLHHPTWSDGHLGSGQRQNLHVNPGTVKIWRVISRCFCWY